MRSALPHDETTRTEIDVSPDMDFGPTHVDTALSMAKALQDVRKATSAPRPTPKPAAVAAVPRPRPKRPDVSFRSYAHLSPCTDLPKHAGSTVGERESSGEIVADVITVTAPFVASPAPSPLAPQPPRATLPTPTAFVASSPSEDTARRLFSPFYAPVGPGVTPLTSPVNDTQTAFAALDEDAAVLAMRPARSSGLFGAVLLAVGLAAGLLFGASSASPPPKGASASHVAATTLAATPSPVAAALAAQPSPVAAVLAAQPSPVAATTASPKADLELPASPPPEKRVVAATKTKVPTVVAPQVTKVPAPQISAPSPKAPAAHTLPTSDGDTSAATRLLEASRAATENTL